MLATHRSEHEIAHGRKLAAADPEQIWGWGTPAGRQRAERRGALIAEAAGLRPGVRALEVGCGTGLFTEMFSHSGATLVAVDISSELIELAQQRGLPVDQVCFVAKPFEESDAEGPFDAIIGSSILHHLALEPAVRRMYELLKPGGVISFAEPNMLNPQIAVQKNVPWIKARLGDSPDETAIVRWSFARLLAQAGFTDMRLTPFDWLHPRTPASLVRTISGAGRILERLPLLREFAGSLLIFARRPAQPG